MKVSRLAGAVFVFLIILPISPKIAAGSNVISPNPNCEEGSSYVNSKTSLWITREKVATHVNGSNFILAIGYADFDGDGITDIIMAPCNSRDHTPIQISKGLANGKFQEATSQFIIGEIPSCVHARKILITDFNGDNRPDVYIADHGIDQDPYPGHHNILLLSNAAGQLEYIKDHEDLVGFWHGATAADFDNDGDIDIFVTPGMNGILMNDGKGHFTLDTSAIKFRSDADYTAEFIDVDKDGFIDLLIGGHEFEGGCARIYWGNEEGIFSESQDTVLPIVTTYGVVVDIDVEDLNGDGLKDVVVTRTKSPPYFYKDFYIQIIMQKDAKNFTDESMSRIIYDMNTWVGNLQLWIDWIRLVDYDHNGSTDIVVDNSWLNLRWKNDGQGYFAIASTLGSAKILVKDSNGNPILGANVSLSSQPSGQTNLNGTSSVNGTVIFNDVLPGVYILQASKGDYVSATGTLTVVAGSSDSVSLTLQAQQSSGGGIPGFQLEAVAIGVLLCALWWWTQSHRFRKLEVSIQ